jgi:LysR family glycine cleavage system transcriptional activator
MDNRLRLNFPALLALETAERYRSFTAAARELNVTRSAVSHRIRHIEKLLEKPLFERTQWQMIPTSTCTRVAECIRRNLTDIEFALLEAKHESRQQQVALKVNVMADFANVWLIPRLKTFYGLYPNMDLSITVRYTLNAPEGHEADLGIWHRSINREGFRSKMLLNDSASLPEVALAGQGVDMLGEQQPHFHLREGTLAQIGSTPIHSSLPYHLCWREDNPKQEAILQFSEWLEGTVRQAD